MSPKPEPPWFRFSRHEIPALCSKCGWREDGLGKVEASGGLLAIVDDAPYPNFPPILLISAPSPDFLTTLCSAWSASLIIFPPTGVWLGVFVHFLLVLSSASPCVFISSVLLNLCHSPSTPYLPKMSQPLLSAVVSFPVSFSLWVYIILVLFFEYYLNGKFG